MGFADSIKHVFQNITNFEGRASRSEFWWWFLFVNIVWTVVYLIEGMIGLRNGTGFGFLTMVLGIILFLCNISVGCRRLHDTGKSGWWQLLIFACGVGYIVLIVFWILDSNPGDNKYGGPAPTA